MIVIEKILGNIKKEPLWQQRLSKAHTDIVELHSWEAHKSRCRKITRDGLELGIALERHQTLVDGDILQWDQQQHRAVIVQITLRDVMVIDVKPLLATDTPMVLRTAFELGHALGNQHWKAVITDHQIYIPLTVSASIIIESVIKTHDFQSLRYNIVNGESILPHLTQREARLLFGGAEEDNTHVHVDTTLAGQPVKHQQ